MSGASRRKLVSFARDARGNVALLFGLSLIPLLIGVGVAVDYGRALIVHERMQEAADAAGLAIGSWVGAYITLTFVHRNPEPPAPPGSAPGDGTVR